MAFPQHNSLKKHLIDIFLHTLNELTKKVDADDDDCDHDDDEDVDDDEDDKALYA